MCLYQKKIFNHYIDQWLWVNCGRCKACLQQKANARAARIRLHAQRTGEISLFFGLTYDDDSVPYVLKSDCCAGAEVPVYRQKLSRYVGSGSDVHLKRYDEVQTIGNVSLKTSSQHKRERMDFPSFDNTKLPSVRYDVRRNFFKVHKDRTAVCFFKDWQDFYKRLNVNLKRNENISDKLSYFVCSEYGSNTKRCHFHVLLFCRPEIKDAVERCIYKSWPYSDKSNCRFKMETARSAASYVASYVNSGSGFPRLLKEFMPPKHSYSQNFGLDSRFFQLDAILAAIKQGNLVYPVSRMVEGRSQPCFLPIPKYVLSRYFPCFKGFSNMSSSEIFRVVLSPKSLLGHRAVESCLECEIEQYACRLRNAFGRFRQLGKCCVSLSDYDTGYNDPQIGELSIYDYAYWFVRCWSAYRSTLIRSRLSLQNENPLNYWSCYDNIMDFHSLEERPSIYRSFYFMSPNDTPLNVKTTRSLEKLFDLCNKTKSINNEIYSSLGYDV